MTGIVLVYLVIFGLCFGSFTSALVWRLHEQSKPKKKRIASDQALSMMRGRSMCSHCHHALVWYDLLPLISWLSLGGKCRYCHKPIQDSPLVEIIMAALFVVSYVWWPYSWSLGHILLFGVWLIFIVGFMALSVYDLRWMLLPDKIVFPLQILAGAQTLALTIAAHDIVVLANAALALVCSAGFFYVIYRVSGGKWIGGGDVKLAVVLGLLVGTPARALLMLFIASLSGCMVTIPLLIAKKADRHSHIPFGPFLIFATFVVYIFGAALIMWYRSQLLII